MCGITGIVSPVLSGLPARVGAMTQSLHHRGPDDSGVYQDGAVCLGHTRLSIIDLSNAGHQPMILDGGRLACVFNGEVFNYRELRAELEGLGARFVSDTDTEVLLRAYELWGEDCVTRFNGMWGFAIWDKASSVLFCSRDRLGVKPFYHRTAGAEFSFASETKALLRDRAAEVNHQQVVRFLRTSLADDTEATCFSGISQLLPGHSMRIRVTPDGATLERLWRYWDFDADHSHATYDYSSPSDTLRELLGDSVRLRLHADVPVGTCLSGGLDSSAIVAMASSQLDRPVWTFSSLYDVPGYDERRFAELVSDTFHTDAHQVTPEPGRLLEVLPRITWHQDLPSSAPGVYSQWHVMEMASQGVTVLLDGQGADELLGGYHYYFADYLRSRLRAAMQHPSSDALSWLLRDAARLLPGKLGPRFMLSAIAAKSRQRRPEVMDDYLRAHDAETSMPVVEDRLGDPLGDRLLRDTFTVVLPSLLRYEDRNSMAFSVEARTPFLDYRIVEYCLALPFDQRIRGPWTKYALRKAMEPLLPSEITWRRDKLGYPTPIAEWLRGPFREDALEIITSDQFRNRGVFDPKAIDSIWSAHQSGRTDNSWNIWRWLSLEMWFRTFIDAGRGAAR